MKDLTTTDTFELLTRLGKAWDVTLSCTNQMWQLRIQSRDSEWDESFSYVYRGSLASVVARAYAGEPDDKGSEVAS